jgi:hypothetical protein
MDDLPFDPAALVHKDTIGAGLGGFAQVAHIKGSNLVVKIFPPDREEQRSERKIYEHLRAQGRQHPNILKFYGQVPSQYDIFRGGLVFEYHHRGTLRENWGRLNAIDITKAQKST